VNLDGSFEAGVVNSSVFACAEHTFDEYSSPRGVADDIIGDCCHQLAFASDAVSRRMIGCRSRPWRMPSGSMSRRRLILPSMFTIRMACIGAQSHWERRVTWSGPASATSITIPFTSKVILIGGEYPVKDEASLMLILTLTPPLSAHNGLAAKIPLDESLLSV